MRICEQNNEVNAKGEQGYELSLTRLIVIGPAESQAGLKNRGLVYIFYLEMCRAVPLSTYGKYVLIYGIMYTVLG